MKDEKLLLKVYFNNIISGLNDSALSIHLYDVIVIEQYKIAFYLRIEDTSTCIVIDYGRKIDMTLDILNRIKLMTDKEDKEND